MSATMLLEEIPANPSEFFHSALGKTYDSAFQRTRRLLLTNNVIRKNSLSAADTKDTFFYDFIADQRNYSKRISASASGKGSFGFGKAKASASFRSFFSSNSYSCYILGYMRLIHPAYFIELPQSKIDTYIEQMLEKYSEKNIDRIEALLFSSFKSKRRISDNLTTINR